MSCRRRPRIARHLDPRRAGEGHAPSAPEGARGGAWAPSNRGGAPPAGRPSAAVRPCRRVHRPTDRTVLRPLVDRATPARLKRTDSPLGWGCSDRGSSASEPSWYGDRLPPPAAIDPRTVAIRGRRTQGALPLIRARPSPRPPAPIRDYHRRLARWRRACRPSFASGSGSGVGGQGGGGGGRWPLPNSRNPVGEKDLTLRRVNAGQGWCGGCPARRKWWSRGESNP